MNISTNKRLFKVTINEVGGFGNHSDVYVVTESYSDAEKCALEYHLYKESLKKEEEERSIFSEDNSLKEPQKIKKFVVSQVFMLSNEIIY